MTLPRTLNDGLRCLLLIGFIAAPALAQGRLELKDAIRLALENNVSVRLARAGTEEARGIALQRAARLLPTITATASQVRVFKANLEAQGFSPGTASDFPLLVGPYNTFDARFNLVEDLLNVSAIWRHSAGRIGEQVARDQEDLARDQVAAAAALAYLEALRSKRAVSAAQADLSLSDSLWKLARDQHAAGIASGVDVARAETERAKQNLRLIRAQVAARDADIRLKRLIGLPLDQTVELQELQRVEMGDVPSMDQAIGLAINDRAELRISRGIMNQNRRLLRAAASQFLPTVRAVGDYGYSGTTPSNTARTGSIGGRLSLPIFAGGERKGDILEARGHYDEAQARAEDLKIQVETDVRLALQELSASTEETRTAEQALKLAQTELKMARDRYSAGVGDNIQVLSAQASLAGAEDDQVTALAHYDVSRANLAAALGRIQELR